MKREKRNDSDLSRRTFLSNSGAIAGSAFLGSSAMGASLRPAGSDELKAVLIGAGGRGCGAAGNFLKNKNTKIVAVADLFEGKAKGGGKRFNVPEEAVFSGFDAYRKALAVDCDVAILATPPGFRPIHYKAAIEAGKHVFMEKPCCVDAPGFNMLQEANKLADQKNLKVGVGLQRRHQAGYLARFKEVQDGKYGDLILLRAYWNGGGVWTRKRTKEMTEMYYQCNNWYYFNWLCGDNIAEQHVHNIDICNWYKGAHPVEANGMGARLRRDPVTQGEIFDQHFIEFTYPDGTKMYSQCRHIRGCWNSVSEAIHGTKGTASGSARVKGPNPYDQEHVDLVDAIRNNKKYNEGWYGATSSMTAVLGRMASHTGKKLSWDDAVKKGPALMIYEGHDKLTFDSKPPVMPDEKGHYKIPMPGITKPF